MSDISNELQEILSAVYGEEVRSSIHDALRDINIESTAANATSQEAKAIAETAQDSAKNSATLAESYAKGGTGTRAGEDTDNAKYYSDKIAEVAEDVDEHINDTTIHITDTERATWNSKGTYSKPTDGIPKTDLDSTVQASLGKADNAIPSSEKGAANGVARLDENGLILSSELPSYVDDVLEFNAVTDFPATGESGKIYVATSTNITYRWTGTVYVAIGSDLALGETSSTAYAGDKGKKVTDDLASHKGDNTIHVTATEKAAWDAKSAFSGDYNDLTNKPTIPTKVSELTNDSGYKTTDTNTTYSLTQDATDGHKITLTPSSGSAQTITIPDNNTWRPLGTTSGTACAGDDSRLSNSRPASDVYSWAKASSKPSYSASEISGLNGASVNYATTATRLASPSGTNLLRHIDYKSYSSVGGSTDTSTYFQNLIKWICATYPNDIEYVYIGLENPNSQGYCTINIYNNSDLSGGLPRYCSGVYFTLGGNMHTFGTFSFSWYFYDNVNSGNIGSQSVNYASSSYYSSLPLTTLLSDSSMSAGGYYNLNANYQNYRLLLFSHSFYETNWGWHHKYWMTSRDIIGANGDYIINLDANSESSSYYNYMRGYFCSATQWYCKSMGNSNGWNSGCLSIFGIQ